jgi:hypothetical protein
MKSQNPKTCFLKNILYFSGFNQKSRTRQVDRWMEGRKERKKERKNLDF